ncbi:MAG: hypothetical protein ACKVUS_15940 [Saprospiraceae bacterium]
MVQVIFTVSVDNSNEAIIEQIRSLLQAHRAPVTIQIIAEPNAALGNSAEDILIDDIEDDFEKEMSEEHITGLKQAIKMSYDKRNLIPQDMAKQMLQTWLDQNERNG